MFPTTWHKQRVAACI